MSEEGSKSPHYQANLPQVLPHPGLQGTRLHRPTLAARKSIGPAAPHLASGGAPALPPRPAPSRGGGVEHRPCRPVPSQGEPCEPQVHQPDGLWPPEQPTCSAPSEVAGAACVGRHHT